MTDILELNFRDFNQNRTIITDEDDNDDPENWIDRSWYLNYVEPFSVENNETMQLVRYKGQNEDQLMVCWYPSNYIETNITEELVKMEKYQYWYRIKQYEFVKYFLMSRSDDSLQQSLEKNEWMFDMSVDYTTYLDITEFCVTVGLTESGKYQIFNVMELIFNYVKMLEENVITREQYEQQANIK